MTLSLAEKLRPQTLEDIVGQDHLLGKGKSLRRFLEEKKIPSLILWGPPGSEKTMLADCSPKKLGSPLRLFLQQVVVLETSGKFLIGHLGMQLEKPFFLSMKFIGSTDLNRMFYFLPLKQDRLRWLEPQQKIPLLP